MILIRVAVQEDCIVSKFLNDVLFAKIGVVRSSKETEN
jgi:hypothetical protein